MADNTPDLPESIGTRDVQAFERLFLASFEPLSRFVFSYVRSWETAKELVDDAFLRLWLRLGERTPVENVKSYLYTTARHLALQHLNHRRVETRYLERHVVRAADGAKDTPTTESDQALELSELAAAIQRAVDQLPPQQREVIVRRWKDATYTEIAQAMGIAPATVAEHFRRAVRTLSALLADLK